MSETLNCVINWADFETVWKDLRKVEGFVKKKERITFEGEKCWLVWDYIVFNELGILTSKGEYTSLKTNFSDEEMEKEFDRRYNEWK